MNPATIAGKDRVQLWYQVHSGRFRRRQPPLLPGDNGDYAKVCRRDGRRLMIHLANSEEREAIYRLRHEVYARELGQYEVRPDGRLTDALDAFNVYLVVTDGKTIHGFISITPPGHGKYSVDKYVKREDLPFPVDDKLYEIRIMTVPQPSRRSLLATLLMYAAFRWIESHGVVNALKSNMRPPGPRPPAGAALVPPAPEPRPGAAAPGT